MALVKYNPLRELRGMQEQMNRLLNISWNHDLAGEDIKEGIWQPAVDIYETENDLVFKADLPEVDQKDIDVRVENQTLTISGQRKFEKTESNKGYHRIERSYGNFQRSFAVPNTFDTEKIAASFKNGVLSVTLPKKEAAKPRQVKVEVQA